MAVVFIFLNDHGFDDIELNRKHINLVDMEDIAVGINIWIQHKMLIISRQTIIFGNIAAVLFSIVWKV